MRTIKIEDSPDDKGIISRSIIFDGNEAKATWTTEVEEDLRNFHGMNISHEVAMVLVYELDEEFKLTTDERAAALSALKEHMDSVAAS